MQIKRVDLDQPGAGLRRGRAEANAANGMAPALDGGLLVCEQGTRSEHARISRLDRETGERETVVDQLAGLALQLAERRGRRERRVDLVHRPELRPPPGTSSPSRWSGTSCTATTRPPSRSTVVADSFDKPNGLAFSPDERILYVTDSGANQEPGSYHVDRPHHIKAFDVIDGRRLAGERLFAVTTPGFPDGLKVDSEGRVYASSFSGVQVLDPGGQLIGEIRLPGAVNFCFGGPERNLLFITTDSAVWVAELAAKGA